MPTYRTIPPLTEQQILTFSAHIDKTPGQGPQGDCHEWQGCRYDSGHGQVTIKRVTYKAHRVAFLLANGTIDPTLETCHTCDNPPCCNGDHLWQGTHYENVQDCVRKGRNVKGESHRTRVREKIKRGEDHCCARLNVTSVLQIRALYASGEYTYDVLAQKFGVHSTTIRDVITRRNWKHV